MIVLSIFPKSYSEYLTAVKYQKKYSADLIEVRCEKLSMNDFKKIIFDNSTKKVITYKPSKFSSEEFEKLKSFYQNANESSVRYIDVDVNWGSERIDQIKNLIKHSKFILSYHNYNKTPRLLDLIDKIHSMVQLKPDVIKIVTKANSVEDNKIIFDLLTYAQINDIKLASHCMGEEGKVSRILGKKFGSYFIYTSMSDDLATADGQLSLEKLNRIFHIRKINSKTKVFGIIGDPITQSKSWLYHNYGFELKKINAVYLNFKSDKPITFLAKMGNIIDGLSVTIPNKEKILAINYIKSKSNNVDDIGSANTLLHKNNKYFLYNTDYLAFKEFIENNKELQNGNVLVIGAGGTSRAIIFALKQFRNKIYLINRNVKRRNILIRDFDVFKLDNLNEKGLNFDAVINTTPGDNEFISRISEKIFSNYYIKLAFDVSLSPLNTKFLTTAKKMKVKTINGLDFFLKQAHIQFKIFTGKDAPRQNIQNFIIRNYSQTF
ncbi:MAG: type I 3-dehydroquinate dehydratase [Ignavibacteria bacterium]|nr:type I 3-dehydroquinate dehydratase [Ignavibacteria bacterium]